MRLPAIQRVLGAIVLLFRQTVNFCGGMGIVMLAVAILPMLKAGGFCSLYIPSYLILAGTGEDIVTAFSASAASMNNLGSGLGEVNVHFRDLNTAGVWVSDFAMVLGRLEAFTVLVLFLPGFWRE